MIEENHMPSEEVLALFKAKVKRNQVPAGVVACGYGTWVRASDIVRVSTPKTKQEAVKHQVRSWVTLSNGDRIPCSVKPAIILNRWAEAVAN